MGRAKGKREERRFVQILKQVFPDIRRNAFEQSQNGGVDLISEQYPQVAFEVKGGKRYKSKMIRDIIDQLEAEGKHSDLHIACIHPQREDNYYICTQDTILRLLEAWKQLKN